MEDTTTKVLVFGATSMVGSHYVQHSGMSVHAAGRTDPGSRGVSVEGFSPIELARTADVEALVRTRPEPIVVNFAARTDVDRIEQGRTLSGEPSAEDDAWRINALAPEAMARGARFARKYFVQISTDFVFDGTAGPYEESTFRSPLSARLSWYGWTKSEGERRVEGENAGSAVLRISYPYRSAFPQKLDFARGMVAKHRAGALQAFYSDQTMTPTWVPDVTRAIHTLVQKQETGVFHAASPETTTPYEFAHRLFQRLSPEGILVEGGSLVHALQHPGATPRPVNGGLRCHRLAHLGIQLTGWREGIDQLVSEEGWV